MTTYVIAGGCFWCLDAVYRRIKGVASVVSGYAGGRTTSPRYEDVLTGETGHAESVQITFDKSIISSDVILDLFFLIHDPTTLNRQGNDIGTQYRSLMLYADDTQKEVFQAAMTRAETRWDAALTTELKKLDVFYPAEDYHQDYFNKDPSSGYCTVVVAPKVVKARAAYAKWFKDF